MVRAAAAAFCSERQRRLLGRLPGDQALRALTEFGATVAETEWPLP